MMKHIHVGYTEPMLYNQNLFEENQTRIYMIYYHNSDFSYVIKVSTVWGEVDLDQI